MRAPLHAPSDQSAVSHSVALLIGVHAIYVFLAADLRLFSFSRDFDTAFAAAAIAPALVIAMIQTLNASFCRERMPKIFCNDYTMV